MDNAVTIEAIEAPMVRVTDESLRKAEREAHTAGIERLTRQYVRGLLTVDEYHNELAFQLERMMAPCREAVVAPNGRILFRGVEEL